MRTAAVAAVLLVAVLAAGAQNVPAPGSRAGVISIHECMDKARNAWIADIDAEVQKMQAADAGRTIDLNPKERLRIRTKILDHSNKRRLEVYTEIVRLTGVVGKERGFDFVHRIDPMPVLESGDAELVNKMEQRDILHHDPSIDLTVEVLTRLNRDYADRRR
jgi:hypothetical protein